MSHSTIRAQVQVTISGAKWWLVAVRTEDPKDCQIEVYWLTSATTCDNKPVPVWEYVPRKHWGDLLEQAIEANLLPLIAGAEEAA